MIELDKSRMPELAPGQKLWLPNLGELRATLPMALPEIQHPIYLRAEPDHGMYAAAYHGVERGAHRVSYTAPGRALEGAQNTKEILSEVLGIEFIATPASVLWHELTHAAQRERYTNEFQYRNAVIAEQRRVALKLLMAQVAGDKRAWWTVYASQPAEREAFIRGSELAAKYPDILLKA